MRICHFRIITVLIVLPILLNFGPGLAFAGTCTVTKSSGFQKALDQIENEFNSGSDGEKIWKGILAANQKYADCDDGFMSEGMSDVVVRLLSSQWAASERFFSVQQNNYKFVHFVLKHIDMTVAADDIERIRKNANTDCRHGLQKFCAAITQRITELDKEAAEIRAKEKRQ